MNQDPKQLYLDLLKKSLTFSLWPEPVMPVHVDMGYRRWKYVLLRWTNQVLGRFRFELGYRRPATEEMRRAGEIWPVYAHTMVGRLRLDNLQFCIESVLADSVPGDLIETGVWRGGSSIFMRGVLAANAVQDRRVIVADSFAGLPPPNPGEFPVDHGDSFHRVRYLAVSLDEVQDNFRKYGLLDEQVVFLKGWFEETLATAPTAKLAILRMDGDMYSSTMAALTSLYPKLSPGGYCIVDDYSLKGARAAVTDYRNTFSISDALVPIDAAAVYWRKGSLVKSPAKG